MKILNLFLKLIIMRNYLKRMVRNLIRVLCLAVAHKDSLPTALLNKMITNIALPKVAHQSCDRSY